jgi:superfamily II DNA/RNA helicase
LSISKLVGNAEDFGLLDGPNYDSLYARVHARAIRRYRRTSQKQRPDIDEYEAEQACEFAYEQIFAALRYLAKHEADQRSKETLRNAAQILEKLYWDEPAGFVRRAEGLETAALAYYLAGYYARAYVLVQGVDRSTNSSNNLMRLMFLRELPKIRELALQTLSQVQYRDVFLANSIAKGEIDQTKAINLALGGTLYRVYLLFYEYARTGNDNLIDRALDLCNVGVLFAIDQQLQDWWWTFYCTVSLLNEYHRNSLWVCLRPMIDGNPRNPVRLYIREAFWHPTRPILELWRSQSHVVENINDGRSYCVKMPTGSGKTRIAEVAILKFLLDTQAEPSKKCLYVAPYRALAVELEQSLRGSFEPIGVGVSQLYGSNDLNPAESLIVADSKVLIATPEKMDAFLRYNTDIAQQVRLIIIDEGHIIDGDERGLRFELFVHRLVRRFERNGTRMLFISAVMPNLNQFSQWITGRDSDDGVLTSDWQSTQLLLGILQWNGNGGRVRQLYRNRKALDGEPGIADYVRELDPDLLKESKSGKKRYPGCNPKTSNIVALAALEASKEGPVLIFTPLKRNVESIAKRLIEAIELQESINGFLGLPQPVLKIGIHNKQDKNKFDRCLSYAEECTGRDSIIVKALNKGFVIHNGNVPRALRVKLEELVRDRIIHVVVATRTLSQGVNLPVKTILIHSLYDQEQKSLSWRDFWNLCGRAGRPMSETEGYVYVVTEPNKEKKIRDKIDEYVRQAQSEEIMSAIRQLLENVVGVWKKRLPRIDTGSISMLCQQLTDEDECWLSNGNDDWLTKELRARLRDLDSALLALIEEQQLLDITSPDRDLTTQVMDLFQDSLFCIQMNSGPSKIISKSEAISLLVQRVEHIMRVCKTTQRRRCYYRMGLSLEGCNIVERSKDDLVVYLQRAERYMYWKDNVRAEYIVKLCKDFLMPLEDIGGWKESDKPSDCWLEVLALWLMGQTASEIESNVVLPGDCNTTLKVSTLIDHLCEFRLPWGLNAITMFWQNFAPLSGSAGETPFTPPEVVNYFPSMLRFGVHSPVATVALSMGLDNRKAALELSKQYSGPIDAQSILFWLRTLDHDIVGVSIDDEVLRTHLHGFITSIQKHNSFIESFEGWFPITETMEIEGYTDFLSEEENMNVISYYEKETGIVHFLTQAGDYVGTIARRIENPEVLKRFQSGNASVSVKNIIQRDDEVFFELQIG